jgi:hypothetical protein
VDFLTGRDVTIRIEALNHTPHNIRNGIFLVRTMFPYANGGDIAFDPSETTIELANGSLFKARGFPCRGTITDRSYFVSAASLVGFQRVDHNNYCYFLFFDSPPPRVDEGFIMRLNGVRLHGKLIDVPEIIFRQGNG